MLPRHDHTAALKLIVTVFLLAATVASGRAQTFQTWRGEASSGSWQGSTNWWNFPNGSPVVFGQQEWDNNHFLEQTNSNSGSTLNTWRWLFRGGASSVHTFGGDAVRFFDSGGSDPQIENQSTATHIINMNIAGDGDSADPLTILIQTNGGLTFNGTVNNQGSTINVQGNTGSAATVTFGGVMSGSGGIYKENSNITLLMTAANTLSGQTTIQSGTLRLSGSGSLANSAVRLHSGGTLSVANSATVNSVAEFGSGNAGVIAISNGAVLTVTADNLSLFQNSISGAGGLTKQGSHTLALYGSQSYTGATTVAAGRLETSSTLASGSYSLTGGTLAVSGTNRISTNNNVTFTMGGGTLRLDSGEQTLNGAMTLSGSTTSTISVSGSAGPMNAAGAIGSSGSSANLIKEGGGQLNLIANNTYSGTTTVNNGSLEVQSANGLGSTSGSTTVNTGAELRLWNAGGVSYAAEALTLNGAGVGSGGALRNITNNNTWQGAITLGSSSRINSDVGTLTVDVASGNAIAGNFDLTIGGAGNVTVSDNIGIGSSKLVKDGLGTLTLGAVNNYTGNTEINAGTLSISSNGGLSSSSILYLGSGLNNSDATLLLAGTTTLANAIQVNNTNAAGSGGARFITKSDATAQTLSGNFTNNMQTSVNVANSAGRLTVSGPMAGAGNIVKVGEGTLALSGNSSSFSGGLFIDQGTLDLAGGSTGASAIDIGGGAPVNSINASNATLRVSANSTFSTPLTVNANTNALGQSGNRTIDFANSGGTATLSGPLSVEKGFTVNVANSGATGILGGTITGSGGPQITVTGNGILGLTDLNSTTSARWNVQSGSTLAIGNTRNLGTNPANYFVDKVALNGGTLLATNNFSLNANVGIQLGASTSSTISVGSGLVMTNPAVMNGSGNLTKSGSGMLVLSGANSNTGTVTVAAGELRVNGSQTAANGALTVNAGATLSGNGTIGGATTISGIHNPGNSPGVQSFNNNLTYNSGSTVNWELIGNTVAGRGTSFDGIDLLGSSNLNFSGATSLNLVFNGAGSSVRWQDAFWGSNRSWLVYDLNGGVVQNFGNFTLLTQNWADSMTDSFNTLRPDAFFSVARTGEDVFLVYTVPEPSTWALLALGAGVLGHRLLKRKK